eukprot:scaffold15252_cov93-Isochrysis_galbana.AAC.2
MRRAGSHGRWFVGALTRGSWSAGGMCALWVCQCDLSVASSSESGTHPEWTQSGVRGAPAPSIFIPFMFSNHSGFTKDPGKSEAYAS